MLGPGADPGFVERGGGGAAATASATGAKVFGESRLKTLFGISKGRPLRPPPVESASDWPTVYSSSMIYAGP